MDLIFRFMSIGLQIYCITFTILFVSYRGVQARIVSGPANTAEIVGSTIQLKCTISQRTCDEVVWSTTESAGQIVTISIDTKMRQTFGGRYHVNVSTVGECTLNINGLQMSDAGMFTCDASTTVVGTERKSAILSVLDSSPQLTSNATQTVLEGDKVNISCSLKYQSKLQVTMQLTQAGDIHSEQVPQASSSINTFAIVTAKRKEVVGPFRCRVILMQTQASAELARNRVELLSNQLLASDVHFPVGRSESGAIVPCNLEPAGTTFAPGKSVKCQCDGFPEAIYKWIRRSDNVTVVNEQVISINQSTPSAYQCVATNAVNGVTYKALSPEVNFNGTEPILSASVAVPLLVSIVVVVLLVIVIIGFIIWKKKKSRRSQSNAMESSKSNQHRSMPLVKPASPAKPLSNPVYERPAAKPVLPVESPPTPPDPLPSPTGTRVAPPMTAARRQPPNAPPSPSRTKTPDVVPYSVPARPVSPAQSNRESDQIVYAEIERPPQKPPRSTSTPQSDTIYASIASA